MEDTASGVKLIDTPYYSFGFPNENWRELIRRDNYLAQIEGHLQNGTDLIFLEGDEDSGKTTLCGQFAKKHITNTISVFFNPLNILDYSIEYYCTNVVCQIKHLLNENQSEIDDSLIGIEEYQRNVFQLRKKIKGKVQKINLVIDGLEEKAKEGSDFVKKLFTILPFGEGLFNIILSGNCNDYINIFPKIKKGDFKTVGLAGFTEFEIRKYLAIEEDHSLAQINNLFKVTKGYPGRLKTLKRLIQNEKYSLEEITQSTTYGNWVEIDCESINTDLPINNAILSLLALSDKSFPLDEIAQICSIPNEKASALIKGLNVLDSTGKDISFVSSAHKKYFTNKLRGNKHQVQQLLIDYYTSTKDINYLVELPKLHAEKNDWGKIIDILNDEFLPKVLDNTGSLKIVTDSLALGVKASEKTNKYSDLWKYSIQGSIVNELDNYLFWESEINARIAIRDFAGAISLAESAVLRVDRIRLLALIAKRQKQLNGSVDEDLIKLIQDLYNTTELHSIGDKIYDVVADLIYAIPNLAIEIIEKSSGDVSENSINDWIIAKLSIAAIDSSLKENEKLEDSKKVEAIQNLNNPSVKKINRAISFLVGNYGSDKVIEEVNKLSDSKERLRLLRLWLNNNRSDAKGVEDVIDLALNELVVSTSNITVTIDILKELSYQLPYIKDKKTKKKLLLRFKEIEKGVSDLGLTKNKFIYQLNMFHALISLEEYDAKYSINGILKEIDSIPDTLIKLDSFSEVYSKLYILEQSEELRSKIKFVHSRMLTLSKELFSSTASHYKISQYLLRTIGKKNPVLALKICEEINTADRREKAKLLILSSYLENNIKHIKFELLKQIEQKLEFPFTIETVCLKILERYSESKNLHFSVIKSLFYYGDKVRQFQNPHEKVEGLVLMYKILSKNQDWKKKLSKATENLIYNAWQLIEADWQKIDIGFTICADLSKIAPDFSKRIFDESEKIKKASWIDSQPVAQTYIYTLRIILKAFVGLLVSKNDTKDDYKIIEELIGRIPSEIEKSRLWTYLGIQAYIIKREDVAKNISDNHIILLLESLINKNIDLEPVLDSLTLIHLFNSDLAFDFLNKIQSSHRSAVFNNISEFYISKQNPFEIYEADTTKYNVTYSDLAKAANIIGQLDVDNLISYQISEFCKAANHNRNLLTKIQINELANKLSEIVKNKLPDPKNIKHQGFVILATARIAKLKRESINNNTFWTDLIDQANNIPNKSDEVFVKAAFLVDLPFDKIPNGNNVKSQLFNDIIQIINSFNSHYELVQKVIEVSETMYTFDRTKWKAVVNKAFSVSSKVEEGSEVYSSQKSIIDSMYRIDPNYAKELIKLVDKDDKNYIGKYLHEHFDSLEIANKIKKNEELDQKEKENYRNIVRGIKSALSALNSEKLTSKRVSEISNYLAIGNKLPLHEVFPVFSYYLKNCSVTYKENKLQGAVSDIHRDNFKEAVKAINLIELLSHRRKATERSYKKFFIDEDFETNRAIKPNSREDAFQYIKSWMIDQAENYLIIADPYLQKEDIEILKIVKEIGKDLEIDFLGSTNGQTNNIDHEFQEYWKKISVENAPFSNVTFCWVAGQSDQIPFHDRWILTKNGGMRLGTSINSLGKGKDSELSIMRPTEALKIKDEILSDYINKRRREFNNLRLSYKSFNL